MVIEEKGRIKYSGLGELFSERRGLACDVKGGIFALFWIL